MIKDKIKHKIVNYEKIESVTSHNLYPPRHKLSHFLKPPPPLWSVTYFMDGPLYQHPPAHYLWLFQTFMEKLQFGKLHGAPRNEEYLNYPSDIPLTYILVIYH